MTHADANRLELLRLRLLLGEPTPSMPDDDRVLFEQARAAAAAGTLEAWLLEHRS